MSKLRRVFALSASDWVLLAQAWMWFVVVEVGLTCLPFQKALRVIQRTGIQRTFTAKEGIQVHSTIPERAAYCVGLAARAHVLNSTCLKKALVLYALLARRGFDAQLFIGAAKAIEGQLDAHAWLECQGKTLLGEPAPGRYSTLCALAGSTLRPVQPEA